MNRPRADRRRRPSPPPQNNVLTGDFTGVGYPDETGEGGGGGPRAPRSRVASHSNVLMRAHFSSHTSPAPPPAAGTPTFDLGAAGKVLVDSPTRVNFAAPGGPGGPRIRGNLLLVSGPRIPWATMVALVNVTGGAPPPGGCAAGETFVTAPFRAGTYKFWTPARRRAALEGRPARGPIRSARSMDTHSAWLYSISSKEPLS